VPLQDVAAAMNQGLLMSEEEKRSRHKNLHKVVTTHTSHTWAAVLVRQLLSQINNQGQARMTSYIPKDLLTDTYRAARKRLFLFDYDVSFVRYLSSHSGARDSNFICLREHLRLSSGHPAWRCPRLTRSRPFHDFAQTL
jgi:hypothetical protein